MDIISLLQTVSAAVMEAKTKEADARDAHAKMTAELDAAKADYDAIVARATAEFSEANTAYLDAKVSVDRLKAQVNEALGNAFAPADSRVRMG